MLLLGFPMLAQKKRIKKVNGKKKGYWGNLLINYNSHA